MEAKTIYTFISVIICLKLLFPIWYICTCIFSTPYSLVFEAGQISVRPQDMKSSQDLLKAANIKVIQGSRMPFFSSKVANIKFIQGCLIVVRNFRPHVVSAKRLAKLKRPTDFISKYFWAKIKELGISNRLSVIFPKKADTGIKFLLSKIQIACLSHFTHQMCWRRSFSFILFFNLHLHHKMIETTVSKYIPLLLCVSL